jgi:cytochrome c-type biogenesis protein CcmH/NrfG
MERFMESKQKKAFLVLLSLAFISCGGVSRSALDTLLEFELPEYKGLEIEKERIEELRAGIQRYEKAVRELTEASEQLGLYYKMLAMAYFEKDMFGKAFEAFKEARYYFPDNAVIHYYTALSAGRLGISYTANAERDRYLGIAEKSYERAIDLDPGYIDALYGLSILLVFELDRPREAEPLLNTILGREVKNVDAMFLLARVYILSNREEDAIALYDRIIETTRITGKREEAQANRKKILEGLYGVQ